MAISSVANDCLGLLFKLVDRWAVVGCLRQVLDVIDGLFVYIFDGLTHQCKPELQAISQQYPFEPLKVLVIN